MGGSDRNGSTHRFSGPSESRSDTSTALRIQELGREAQKLDHEADMGSADWIEDKCERHTGDGRMLLTTEG